MFRVSNFEHQVGLEFILTFTGLAKVEILSNCALVSDTNDGGDVAVVTSNVVMLNLVLVLSFLLDVLDQKFLVLLGTVFSDLIRKNFVKVPEEFIVQFTCTVALLAWKTFLIDFITVTSKAVWKILIRRHGFGLVNVFWSDD